MAHPQVLTLNDISYEYPSAPTPLFEHISATFPPGWTAVLGDNGIGKTTLMQLVLGHLKPDKGDIAPKPGSRISAYCPQRTDEAPDNLEDFAIDWSPETLRIRESLKIGDDWAYRYASLSGGEAKRLQIACVLSLRPDLLILDEPTNHVDVPTRLAIAEAMRSFSGIGIVVSHDVDLIEAACSRCMAFERRHMEGRNITAILEFAGGYSDMIAQIERRNHADSDALTSAEKEAKRLRRIRAERFQQVQKANALKRHGDRIDPKDHDARNRRIGAKALSLDANPARQYAQLGGRLAAADERAAGIATAAKRYDGQIWFDIESSHHRELVHLPAGVIRYGSDTVTTKPDCEQHMALASLRIISQESAEMNSEPTVPKKKTPHGRPNDGDGIAFAAVAADSPREGVTIPALSVGPRDHIGIAGPNGGGKTTVVNAVLRSLGYLNRIDGWNAENGQNDQSIQSAQQIWGTTGEGSEIPYLVIAQNTTDDDAKWALAQLATLTAAAKSQVLSSYAQLNADPDRLTSGASPSPGELRKLLLCLGIAHSPQLIIMDEPTNHLDLHSKQALAAALQAYPGALIVVSHEQWFLEQVASTRWEIG
jgi:ATPase subunit of ABC transporter with duplicated ATPase domains